MLGLWVRFVCLVVLSEIVITPAFSFRFSFERSRVRCDNGPRTCDEDYPYRSINGSCNNLRHKNWGMAVVKYKRITPNRYWDGIYEFPRAKSGKSLPLARKVSIVMNPSGNMTSKKFTIGLMQFGQFIAHDASRTGEVLQLGVNTTVECCKDDQPGKDFHHRRCAPILYPKNDPVFKINCTGFERTATTFDHGCSTEKQLAEPLTVVSGLFDLSLLYGSNDDLAISLRTMSKGLMKTVERHCQDWPPQVDNVEEACSKTKPNEACYEGGDVRINQSPQLTSIHVMFLRLHNKFARQLAKLNKKWSDEKLFQIARKITIGYFQHIVFDEYLPLILGDRRGSHKVRPGDKGCVDDYNSRVDPSIIVEFATGAYRGLHSTIAGHLKLIDNDRDTVGDLRLSSNINMPKVLEQIGKDNGSCGECLNYDNLLTSMSYQPQEEIDKYFNVEIKRFLFRGDRKLGIDLRAFDIQRDRDHGVGSWVAARKFCKLEVPESFSDLPKFMSKENARKLSKLYEDVEDIDLSVGGLAEDIKSPSLFGPTFLCIMRLQFRRSRVGDRFFYENCESNSFTRSQLEEIRKASFACLMCETSHCIEKMQPHAFQLVDSKNKLVSCEKLCTFSLKPWINDKCKNEEKYHGHHHGHRGHGHGHRGHGHGHRGHGHGHHGHSSCRRHH